MEIAEKCAYILGIKIFIKREKEMVFMVDAVLLKQAVKNLSSLYAKDHMHK